MSTTATATSPRKTRSKTKQALAASIAQKRAAVPVAPPPAPSPAILPLPPKLDIAITGLSQADLSVLNKKQRRLQRHDICTTDAEKVGYDSTGTVNATLVFAGEQAGTAVCISPDGLLLTCSHCIAESEEELEALREEDSMYSWLLCADGRIVKAECVAWDGRRDLALLRVVAAQSSASTNGTSPLPFPFIPISESTPATRARLVCVGHPGAEDLETSVPGKKTGYSILHVSTGQFRGYAPGQDLHDNSEIGALQHNCWTYWGHSGAPLVEQATGKVVGLHSSWDDVTGMRRGIPLVAIQEFLRDQGQLGC